MLEAIIDKMGSAPASLTGISAWITVVGGLIGIVVSVANLLKFIFQKTKGLEHPLARFVSLVVALLVGGTVFCYFLLVDNPPQERQVSRPEASLSPSPIAEPATTTPVAVVKPLLPLPPKPRPVRGVVFVETDRLGSQWFSTLKSPVERNAAARYGSGWRNTMRVEVSFAPTVEHNLSGSLKKAAYEVSILFTDANGAVLDERRGDGYASGMASSGKSTDQLKLAAMQDAISKALN